MINKNINKITLKEFNESLAQQSIPDGYKPLPYIEIKSNRKSKGNRIVSSFNSESEAKNFIKSLKKYDDSLDCSIIPNEAQSIITNFAVVVPEDIIEFINNQEKYKIVNFPIRKTTYVPIIYRFFNEKKYEDLFFDKGQLLLSNLYRCEQEELNERADPYEFENKFVIKKNNLKIETQIKYDFNTLMLCNSLSQECNNKYTHDYKYGIKINQPNEFIDHITSLLVSEGVDITEVIMGPCTYSDKKLEIDAGDGTILNKFMKEADNGKLNFEDINNYIIDKASYHILMNKPIYFSEENEYRIIWILNRPIDSFSVNNSKNIQINKDGSVILTCTSLIKYCDRISK